MSRKQKMDNITLTALKGSIEKWKKIVNKTCKDDGPDNCPLCDIFYTRSNYCNDCPVKNKTGVYGCHKSPYMDWSRHHYEQHIDTNTLKVKCPECLKLAKEELIFLKSLLPKKEKSK